MPFGPVFSFAGCLVLVVFTCRQREIGYCRPVLRIPHFHVLAQTTDQLHFVQYVSIILVPRFTIYFLNLLSTGNFNKAQNRSETDI